MFTKRIPTKGQSVTVVLTGETGTVTYVSPEGAINVDFPDATNCRLAPNEYRVADSGFSFE